MGAITIRFFKVSRPILKAENKCGKGVIGYLLHFVSKLKRNTTIRRCQTATPLTNEKDLFSSNTCLTHALAFAKLPDLFGTKAST
jgi:hypothetical protein